MGGGIDGVVNAADTSWGIRELLDVKELQGVAPVLGRFGTLSFCEAAIPVLKQLQSGPPRYGDGFAKTFGQYLATARSICDEARAMPRIPFTPCDAEPRVPYDPETRQTSVVVGQDSPGGYSILLNPIGENSVVHN